VKNLVRDDPAITLEKAWLSFPDAEACTEDPVGDFVIYRDGTDLVQEHKTTGLGKKITRRSFKRYVSVAKKEIRNSNDAQ
jgi:hypothetical protein